PRPPRAPACRTPWRTGAGRRPSPRSTPPTRCAAWPPDQPRSGRRLAEVQRVRVHREVPTTGRGGDLKPELDVADGHVRDPSGVVQPPQHRAEVHRAGVDVALAQERVDGDAAVAAQVEVPGVPADGDRGLVRADRADRAVAVHPDHDLVRVVAAPDVVGAGEGDAGGRYGDVEAAGGGADLADLAAVPAGEVRVALHPARVGMVRADVRVGGGVGPEPLRTGARAPDVVVERPATGLPVTPLVTGLPDRISGPAATAVHRHQLEALVGPAGGVVLGDAGTVGGGPLPDVERLAAEAVDQADLVVAAVHDRPLLVGAVQVRPLADLGAVVRVPVEHVQHHAAVPGDEPVVAGAGRLEPELLVGAAARGPLDRHRAGARAVD